MMRWNQRARWLVFFFLVFLALRVFGDGKATIGRSVPDDSYELKYLGCKLSAEPNSQAHVGYFLFIWKGQKPIKVNAYPTMDKTKFCPFPSFSIHNDSGWHGRSEWCGTCAGWVDIQPGQMITFSIDMEWVENEMVGYPSLVGADKAQFHINSEDGDLHSDEFPLPLIPKAEK